ncbi:MAG: hypothetical protein KKA32_13495 [Actinobacteria bacterium]|nr:hypothetical protein [Actinomycetota bacterium]
MGRARFIAGALFAAALLLLGTAGSALAETGTTPTTLPGDPICVSCHGAVSREIVDTWRTQNHGRNGVSCEACHNTHGGDFRPSPDVGVCMGCHDVDAIHPDFRAETSAGRCMDCHTSNVHLRAGVSSWFYSGLTQEKLEGDQEPREGVDVAASTGRTVGVVVAAVTIVLGLVGGFLIDRFARNL